MRGGAFLNGKEGRVGFRTNSTEYGGYIPNPYGRDLGLGYRVRTLPLGRDRWGRYSTEGGYILSFLRKERLGEKGGAFFNGKEGRDDFRKTPSLTVRKDG